MWWNLMWGIWEDEEQWEKSVTSSYSSTHIDDHFVAEWLAIKGFNLFDYDFDEIFFEWIWVVILEAVCLIIHFRDESNTFS